jgi:hypothetical protein
MNQQNKPFMMEEVGVKRGSVNRFDPPVMDKRPRLAVVSNPDQLRHEMSLVLNQMYIGMNMTDRLTLDDLRIANPPLYEQIRGTAEEHLRRLSNPSFPEPNSFNVTPKLPVSISNSYNHLSNTRADHPNLKNTSTNYVRAFVGETVVSLDPARGSALYTRLHDFIKLPQKTRLTNASNLALLRFEPLLKGISGGVTTAKLPSVLFHGKLFIEELLCDNLSSLLIIADCLLH